MRLKNIDVPQILRDYKYYDWTHQGVGFLRTYLDDEQEFRLHLWHPEIQVTGISYIHTHNWDFSSRIVAGGLFNLHYKVKLDADGEYFREAIDTKTGEVVGAPERCSLVTTKRELHMAGTEYFEKAEIVHTIRLTSPCISVIKRDFVEPKEVYSFRHINEHWANVAARPATEKELGHYIPQFKEMLCRV